ncbi:MAG TPA: hypothetical protein VMW95_00625, partial [Desulfobacterales bacterium]|nr:hypothetical protein [Desulfobacterales bacterium]
MKSLTKSVKNFLKQRNIKFNQMDDENHIKLEFAGNNSWFRSFIYIDKENRLILVKTLSPIKTPKNKLLKI